jgi:hypothetical protein
MLTRGGKKERAKRDTATAQEIAQTERIAEALGGDHGSPLVRLSLREVSPSAGPVVGYRRSEQGQHRFPVDVVALADMDCFRGGVVLSLIDDTARVRNRRVIRKT